MSLLLDALNRASKDKAAAAAVAAVPVRAAAGPAAATLELKADSPLPTAAPAGSATADWPTLGLSLTPTDFEPPVRPSQPVGVAKTMVPMDEGMKLVVEPAAPAPQVQPEIKLEVAPIPAAPPAATAAAPTAAIPVAPTPVIAASAPTPAQPQKPAPPPLAAPKTGPADAPRVAQSIQRAKAPSPGTGKSRRLIALGSVAALLAAGLGSVMLGWWGDPMAWFQTSGIQGAALQPAILATRIEPAAPAPEVPLAVASMPVGIAQTPVQKPEISAGVNPPRAAARVRAAANPASIAPVECAPGLTPPDCKAPSRPKVAAATGRSEPASGIQSRSTGPSALELGYAALTRGQLQEATQAYTQALAGNAEERDALLGLAYINHQQGREEDARAYYKRVLRQEPGNPVAKAGLLVLSPTDDAQEPGSRAREVAEQNPDSAAAQSASGHGLVRQGRLADAQLAFHRAYLLEPGVALHAFNLAVALDRLHNYGPAQVYYERALALSTQSGGERASGVTHAVVQARLEQLRSATGAKPAGSR